MHKLWLIGLVFTWALFDGRQYAAAQQPYDPALESYQYGEFQRVQTINRMLLRIEQIRATRPGYPSFLWGYPDFYYAPQSIGQRQVQTGPNRWESFPLYQEPIPFPPPPGISGPREF